MTYARKCAFEKLRILVDVYKDAALGMDQDDPDRDDYRAGVTRAFNYIERPVRQGLRDIEKNRMDIDSIKAGIDYTLL